MMIIAANVAFAIAAVFLGQLFVLRRRAAPTVAVLRFAPNFDAASGGALRAAEAYASASATTEQTSTTSTHASDSDVRTTQSAETDVEPVNESRPEPTTATAEEPKPWPWERKARAIMDPAGHLSPVPDRARPAADETETEQTAEAVETPPPLTVVAVESDAAPAAEPILAADATHELVAPDAAAHEPQLHLEAPPAMLPVDHVDADRYDDDAEDAASLTVTPPVTAAPWWRRLFPRRKAQVETDPLAVHGLRLDDDDASYAVVVPRDDEQQRTSTSEPVSAAAGDVVDDDDLPVLTDSLGLTPERRAEIAAQHLLATDKSDAEPIASTTETTPVVAEAAAVETVDATAPNASLEPVPTPEPAVSAADAARALAEAQKRASAWACEVANSSQPFSVEKRARLLEYYAATINDPVSREMVARVEREDPDLAARAAEILRQAAA